MFELRSRSFFPTYILILSLLLLTSSAPCACNDLQPRSTTVPSPISFASDQNWHGIDGSWSAFVLRVGNPQQLAYVYLSTASQQTWVVAPRACIYAQDYSSCAESRGFIFNSSQSTTWQPIGIFSLWIERNLGYKGNAEYGYDAVGLGGPGEGGVTLPNTTVGALAVEDFYLGIFGVNPKPTNFTSFDNPSPSYMTLLKEEGLIPSLSFGYTAGAKYRFLSVGASLTLGGVDQARFIPNSATFPFGFDNERDIVVSIQKITTDGSGQAVNLLTSPILTYIDSTVPQIWLPLDACHAFEEAFGITYDDATDLYFVNDTQHEKLVAQNPNVTFSLGVQPGKASLVDIVLPYASFDLIASPPYRGLENSTKYFPLRRAANQTQYTLGRTFLQEAYLTVDWERRNFSVAQVDWVYGTPQQIVAIPPPADSKSGTSTHSSQASSSSLGAGAIAGVAVGAAAIVILVGGFLFWRRRRRRKRRAEEAARKEEESHTSGSLSPSVERTTQVYPKAELDANQIARQALETGSDGLPKPGQSHQGTSGSPTTPYSADGSTLPPDSSVAVESDSKQLEVHEMPGDMPTRQEADGRQLSEKQAMMVRERRYNGTDPAPTPPTPNTSVTPQEPPARRMPISPSDITEVGRLDRTMQPLPRDTPQDVLPISPVEEGGVERVFVPLDLTPDTDRNRFSWQ